MCQALSQPLSRDQFAESSGGFRATGPGCITLPVSTVVHRYLRGGSWLSSSQMLQQPATVQLSSSATWYVKLNGALHLLLNSFSSEDGGHAQGSCETSGLLG